ncbi:hypothetical protein G6N74_20720 [Mesorhizobium sp. CGMCC 1.15528]|uniref:Uncharacterized protein n=1 Tax=Mesorhizobium zhangyense TaxID=1776730 RepID=A0A7C9RAA6_9HYPH|nr:hypothetical protein [Mesorhizobium zhangyense]NGN43498.1 hypothetical protein [Mesorhizobium zhangyense]
MGRFLDADIAHQCIFTPEELEVLNFVSRAAIDRLAITTQDEVEHIASAALSLYSTGMTDPGLLLQEVLSRFGRSIKPSAARHVDARKHTRARTR